MDEILAQPTRRRIFDVVTHHPGSSAREVQRLAELAWGETAYHLDQLTRRGVVRRERGGRRDFYFAAAVAWEDRRLFQALRRPAQRRIVIVLSAEPDLTLAELRERTAFSLSTTSFHVRQLLVQTVVECHQSENTRRYRVARPKRVAQLLWVYRASFQDGLLDRFIEAWSGLLGG